MKDTAKTHFGTTSTGMLRSVVVFVFASANNAITQSMLAWAALMQTLKVNLQTIDTVKADIATSITGLAKQKQKARKELAKISAPIMRSVYAYSIKVNDQGLAEKMLVTRSSLLRMKFENLVALTQNAITIITPLIPKLTDYNITANLVQQWQASNTALKDILSSANNGIAHRKSKNEEIQKLIRDSVQILTEQADGMALNFLNNPATINYYNEYRANRKLKPNHVSTQLRATVFNGESPVANAIVALTNTTFKGVTDANGYCLLDGLPYTKTKKNEPLTQTVTVTVDTISKEFAPFRFKKGKSITRRFDMQAFIVPASQVKSKQTVNN